MLNVEFPILPTDTSVGVMERREHRAERASMERLLTSRRIAVHGKGDRVQGLVNSMLGGGFDGEIVAVCTDGCDGRRGAERRRRWPRSRAGWTWRWSRCRRRNWPRW